MKIELRNGLNIKSWILWRRICALKPSINIKGTMSWRTRFAACGSTRPLPRLKWTTGGRLIIFAWVTAKRNLPKIPSSIWSRFLRSEEKGDEHPHSVGTHCHSIVDWDHSGLGHCRCRL